MRLILFILLFSSKLFAQGGGSYNSLCQTGTSCELYSFIDSTNNLVSLSENITKTVIFTGGYFSQNTIIDSPCFSINNINVISHDSLEVNITTVAGEQICDITTTNECGQELQDNVFEIVNFNCSQVGFSTYGTVPHDVSVSGQAIRTGNGNWGNNGIFSNTQFIRNAGEYVEFSVDAIAWVVGLTYNTNPSAGWTEENFSFYTNAVTNTYTRSEESWVASNSWNTSLRLRLEINASNLVDFKIETGAGTGVFNTVRTSTQQVTANLYPHATSGTGTNSTITNYEICK